MKNKFPLAECRKLADEFVSKFSTVTERIAIAGSIRRQNPMCSDIEILYIPKTEVRPDPQDMFASITVNLADEAIAKLEQSGVLERRKNANGSEMFGPKNKLMRHRASGIPVDLFCVTLEQWWVSLVIRTGSKKLNLRLTTGAQKQDATLNAYGSGITLSDGTKIDATSERQVFELCGIAYVEPENR